ncbi:geranylgeranyl reductase family protein [Nonlabens ponticola]|uniref:Geranylgeranyl reductase family protein n=1 Tax=Nonlabens ponticola TaxID=2496866 RepID=A0A3S9MUB2_9FLAO|nr:geranylgeranyl reductase family protein [Nonlabens ponticola]AZQ42740.1 geranylgeranyl reductase family protein [Nonlabens ponticola]
MQSYEVVVVGSGPAGAMAAYTLASEDINVAIIEKESLPRYKTCGGGLTNRAINYLPVDVQQSVEKAFYKVDSNFLKDDLSFTALKEKPIINMVMRDTFDHDLVQKAVSKGATLIDDCKLENLTYANGGSTLETSKGSIECKMIIAADGVLSTTARLGGWEETRYLIPALEYEVEVTSEDYIRLSSSVRFDFDAMPQGYGWCFPKRNHLSIGIASFRKSKGNLKELYRKYMIEVLKLENPISEEMHGFQIPLSPRTDGFCRQGIFLTGDAAGLADPITAEGLANAILSGQLAAQSIIDGKLDMQQAQNLYEQRLNNGLIKELKTAQKLANFIYGDSKLRAYFLYNHGQRVNDVMVSIVMGERDYPLNLTKALANKAWRKLNSFSRSS